MTQEDKQELRKCMRKIQNEVHNHISETKKNKKIREDLKDQDISLYLLGVSFGAQIAKIQMKKLLNGNKETIKPDNHE